MRTIQRSLGWATTIVLSFSAATQAQVLEQVPDDALVVVKVNGLQEVSQKISKFTTELGIAMFLPPLMDPLGSLQQQMGIRNGLDTAGEAAFVMLDPAITAGDSGKSIVLILPVSDYKAFLGNFRNVVEEGEISSFSMPTGDDGFAVSRGKYAIISPAREAIDRTVSPIKVEGISVNELDSNDITVFGNIQRLRPIVEPELTTGREKMLAEIEENLTKDNKAEYIPVAKAAGNQAFNAAEAFFRDSNGAVLGVNLVDTGLNISVIGDFIPESYLGSAVAKVKNTGDSLLEGLPNGNFAAYGGLIINSAAISPLLNDFVEPIMVEARNLQSEDAKKLVTGVETLLKSADAYESATFGFSASNGTLGEQPIIEVVQIIHGDAKAMMEAYRSSIELQNSVSTIMSAVDPSTIIPETVFTENAKTVDGVNFAQFQMKFDEASATPEQQQALQAYTMLYGPEGQTVLYGALDDNNLLVVSGIDDAKISEAIKAARGNANPYAGSAALKATTDKLPQQRIGAFYLSLDQIVTSALHYSNQAGLPAPQITLPPNLPPMGVTVATEGTAVRADYHIPTKLVQSLISAGMQAAMSGTGGPQGEEGEYEPDTTEPAPENGGL